MCILHWFRTSAAAPRCSTVKVCCFSCGRCGEAELWPFVGFLLFSTLFPNFTGNSPEFHQNSSEFTGNSPEFHQNLPEYRIGAP